MRISFTTVTGLFACALLIAISAVVAAFANLPTPPQTPLVSVEGDLNGRADELLYHFRWQASAQAQGYNVYARAEGKSGTTLGYVLLGTVQTTHFTISFLGMDQVIFPYEQELSKGVPREEDIECISGECRYRYRYNYYIAAFNTDGESERIPVLFGESEVTSVSETIAEPGASLYPNPAQNSVTILLQKAEAPTRLTMFNTHGIVVRRAWINSHSEPVKHRLDITMVPNGIYTIVAESGGTVRHFPISVVR